jgi:hypothetical protein
MSIEIDISGLSEQEYGEDYHAHILEIYKTYVEMADNISERRQSANSFFLTLNSAIVALIGYTNLTQVSVPGRSIYFKMIALSGIALSFLWFRLICSYRDINAGKFQVIHTIEKQLPLHPFEAEWRILEKGEKSKLYIPFTNIELFVPCVFSLIYIFVLLGSLL